ncbi:hypothetical protein [Bizionia sp. M204]|uniref:hypothetical protein n=1 Tax=Bizionia sp. M204 TaxID=2675331 RepID=UPI00204BF8C5|nr:hypothetical protein [Bizionia sp. M204]UPS91998.1 hypothetical protein GMA17_09815 [Bizionia sp. M204]
MFENTENNSFWKTGNGKDFLVWANIHEENLISNYSTQLFLQYDDELEPLTKVWLENGDFKTIMKSLHQNHENKNLPLNYLKFKNNLYHVPNWVDFDLIQAG